MTESDYQARLNATRLCGLAAQAAGLVLVHGLTQSEAAKRLGLNRSAVHRAARRLLAVRLCGCCGQELP